MRHKLGSPSTSDVPVFEEPDGGYYVSIGRDASEQMLYISSGSAVTSEVRYLRTSDPEGSWTVVLPRERNVDYAVRHYPAAAGGGEDW